MITTPDPLTIIYQDPQFIAIDKPSGLLVHRSPIDKHETRFAVQMLRDQINQHVYPVHRLDKPTSGILMFGKTPEAASLLSQQWQSDKVTKIYIAICRGYLSGEHRVDHPLIPDQDTGKTTDKTKVEPQEALTLIKGLSTFELDAAIDRYPRSRFSLVQCQPVTGRRHQIRRHLKHLSHPIIGDAKHGKGRYNRYFQQHLSCNRLLLAAVSLRFYHPFDQQTITINAPVKGELAAVIQRFGWQQYLPPQWYDGN